MGALLARNMFPEPLLDRPVGLSAEGAHSRHTRGQEPPSPFRFLRPGERKVRGGEESAGPEAGGPREILRDARKLNHGPSPLGAGRGTVWIIGEAVGVIPGRVTGGRGAMTLGAPSAGRIPGRPGGIGTARCLTSLTGRRVESRAGGG